MSRPLQAALRKAARSSDPYISLLLKETNNIEAARNELRWLREYVEPLRKSHKPAPESGQWIRESSKQPYDHLLTLCQRRAEGEPLQYILGSQPFGELDIKCQRGVLIPRPETEAYTTYLASKISNGLLEEQLNTLVHKARCRRVPPDTPRSSPEFKILDACSGSGCISLLLHNLLSNYIKTYGELRIDGADISEKALQLSNLNLKRNITKGFLKPEAASEVRFMKYDVMQKPTKLGRPDLEPYHIIISNPPYISRLEYETKIPRSVRDWEPKLALVPLHVGTPGDADPADIFYQALIKKYCTNMSSAFMLVMEIGDEMQAKRVLDMAIRGYDLHKTNNVSVWRDSPDARPSGEDLVAGGLSVRTEGQGNVRAVVFLRHLSAIRWPDEEKSG